MLFLHRAVERDVRVLDAQKCVRIATLGGAEALGMEAEVGSLEPGKWADLIAVDISRSHFAPIADPYSALVYGANQDDIKPPSSADASSTATAPTRGADADAARSTAVAVRQKLQDRVRTGAVEVGGAESGWWQTPAHREETV